MPRTASVLAFPTWRDHWASMEEVPSLLTAADALLQERSAGNQAIHRWKPSPSFSSAVQRLHAWVNGKPPPETGDRPAIARRIHGIIQPAMRACLWPRWLLLERAFLDASASGDLLFAAVSLRSMCEELLRLRALDIGVDEVGRLAGANDKGGQEQFQLYLGVAWTCLDGLPREMILEGQGWPSLKLVAKAIPRIERVRPSLNSYVHPNYGSHIAALFPERASAARLLLDAVIAVFDEFFKLSWAKLTIRGGRASANYGRLKNWQTTVRQIQSETLPELQRDAKDAHLAELMKAPL